jgi:hypothetical protein
MPLPKISVRAGGDFGPREVCPAENLRAVITRIYYVGTQPNLFQPGSKPSPKVVLSFTVDAEKSDGSYHVLSGSYTLSAHEKSSLTKSFSPILGNQWPKEGQEFDVSILLGLNCMVDVAHKVKSNGETSANISKVSKLPKGFMPLDTECDQTIWCFDDPGAMEDSSVPNWIKEMAKGSEELSGQVMTAKQYQATAPSMAGHKFDPTAENAPF